jgi:hypothetical protein
LFEPVVDALSALMPSLALLLLPRSSPLGVGVGVGVGVGDGVGVGLGVGVGVHLSHGVVCGELLREASALGESAKHMRGSAITATTVILRKSDSVIDFPRVPILSRIGVILNFPPVIKAVRLQGLNEGTETTGRISCSQIQIGADHAIDVPTSSTFSEINSPSVNLS